MESSSN